MTSPTIVVPGIRQRTPEWMEFRQDKITATDAAIIAGETGSVVELWAQKSGLIEPPTFDPETLDLMEEGLAIEPYLLDFYRRKTGRRVRAISTMRQRKDWPVAVSSPDGEVIGERRGIELKMTTSSTWATAMRAGETVPGKVQAQVQWQAYTAGWDQVDVVVLLHGRPKIIEVPYDPAFVDDLIFLCREFWGWVTSGTRPPMDGSENARRALSRMHPRNDGTLIPPDATTDRVFFDWMAARVVKDLAEAEADTLANTLRALIGDADGIEGRVTWKRNKDSTRTDWPSVAAAYRTVLDDLDGVSCVHVRQALKERGIETVDITQAFRAIESIHTSTVEGARVLRPVKGPIE